MTANALGQSQYAVSVIVKGVGWLTEAEAEDIVEAIGDGQGCFHSGMHQLHLYWSLYADSLEEASREAHTTLRHAREATGVCTPRTTFFELREVVGEAPGIRAQA